MDELELINKPQIWPILLRSRFLILASLAGMIVVALVYTLVTPKVYQATGILQVDVLASQPGSQDTTSANQGLAQNYATLLVSPGFLGKIRKQIDGGHHTIEALQANLSATALSQSALVELKAQGPSPQAAERLAGQVIHAFLGNLQTTASTRAAQLEAQLQASISRLSQQISTLRATPAAPGVTEQISSLRASRQALIAQNATLLANGLAQGTSAAESAAPVASSSPVSPRKSLNLLAGALLGLLLGVALAWGRERLRPAIHSADDVRSLVDLPLLASIPLKSKLRSDDRSISEAYGLLQANLTFALQASDLHLVTVVGYNPQVGKTSTVEGLARAAAARGERRVLMVDGDMRASSLSRQLGHRGAVGLVDVLQGAAALADVLVAVDDGLWLLPTSPFPVNPASLLTGSRTANLLAELRRTFDLVVVDSPPIARLADGLILASHSDVVVLVVRAGLTKPSDLVAAATSLRQHRTSLSGMVVFEELPMERYYGAPSESGSDMIFLKAP